MLGIVPPTKIMQCINHCIIYPTYFIHKERKNILKPDITSFVKCYQYTLTVENDNFAMKGNCCSSEIVLGKCMKTVSLKLSKE